MLFALALLLISLIVAAVVLASILVIGMRSGTPTILRTVRAINRRYLNPRQMATAGRAGSAVSVIRHVGRVSGARHETPVTAHPIDGGFAIYLPYGRTADWTKNVLAAGRAEIVHDGRTHAVEGPEIVPAEAAGVDLGAGENLARRIFGVSEALTLRRSP